MNRVLNFSAGPSMLPEQVLQQARDEMLDWNGTGQSVMEMSHRGKAFLSIAEKLEASLIEVMNIPDNYKVLLLQGGATGQFAMIPQNLLGDNSKACYIETGAWSKKAIQEAQKYCEVIVSASSKEQAYTGIPDPQQWQIDDQAAYLHITTNETIHGVEFQQTPANYGLPLIADMSSNILSREIDVSQYGLIYAGSQKNMGPAGVTVVIIREDLIKASNKSVPSVFDYAQQLKSQSMLNTPATYNWYLVGLVLDWLQEQGGIKTMEQRNIRKAEKLYLAIDNSSLYQNPVDKACRSRMNIPFTLATEGLDSVFIAEAAANGMTDLKGHRSIGGVRASIYNAMPEQGVDKLIEFMAEFERNH
jgi:phosphoserine aminotransferase